jgi:ribosome biogenesis ATPase
MSPVSLSTDDSSHPPPPTSAQALEERHKAAAAGPAASSSDSGSRDLGDGVIGIAEGIGGSPNGGMNRSLASLYGTTPRQGEQVPDGGNGDGGEEAPVAAFASPEAIAAAVGRSAGRALPKEAQQPVLAAAAPAAGHPQSMDVSSEEPAVARAAPATASGRPNTTDLATPRTGKRGGAGERSTAGKRQRVRGGGAGMQSSLLASPLPVMFADLGGIENVLGDIRELIELPLKHPEVYRWLGVDPPRGVLLHGPPGCGKTALANAIANECGVPFLRVAAPEVVSGMSGESEAKIRQLFQEAAALAPCIVFIGDKFHVF